MTRYNYIIADMGISVNCDLAMLGLHSFKYFETKEKCVPISIAIDISSHLSASVDDMVVISTSYLSNIDADGTLLRADNRYAYEIVRRDTKRKATFDINLANNQVVCVLDVVDNIDVSILSFGLWVMLGVALTKYNGLAIHSSAITMDGYCALFLGESGTGKSTHTRLWKECFSNAELLNDDSPIVRIIDNNIVVYGSPWSGKTPCYKNRRYPIKGFVRLSQAPHNSIQRLTTLEAIGALYSSCPYVLMSDDRLNNAICGTLSTIIRHVPTFKMECLPNAAAAILSHQKLFGNE